MIVIIRFALRQSIRLAGLAAALCFCAAGRTAGFSRPEDNLTKRVAARYITAEAVKPLIVELSSDRYGGRGAGYSGERRAADVLAKQYAALGLQPMGDLRHGRRTFFQEFPFYPHAPLHPWQQLKSRNVLAYLEGSDPALRNEIVVIGGHYDGQGKEGEADAGPRNTPLDPKDPHKIWNSANDNLTSCSAVLSIARAIKLGDLHPKRSILFVAFGAEEHEMAGSIFYVNHPVFDRSQHVAMINLECLGKCPDKPLTIDAMMTGSFWSQTIKDANLEMGTAVQPTIPVPIPDSDHYPFSSARIACVVLSGGSDADRHRPTDTAEKIDYPRTAEAARFAFAMIMNLADRDQRPKFTQSPIPDLGMTADLATPAECEVLNLKGNQGCLRVTGVIHGRPAEKAGFQVGDALLGYYTADGQFAPFRRDEKLSELQNLMESMLRGKLGRQLRSTVLRDGKQFELVLPITP
jgi:hypothetical protein